MTTTIKSQRRPGPPTPRTSGDPNEHGNEEGHGPVNPGQPDIEALPDIALQVGPRLDPHFPEGTNLPPGFDEAFKQLNLEELKTTLRGLLAVPEVRYEGVGPDAVFTDWAQTGHGAFGGWRRAFGSTAEAVARDDRLRNFQLLSTSDNGIAIGAGNSFAAGVSIPIGSIQAMANIALTQEGNTSVIGEHTTARIDRIEVRAGLTSSTIDTTAHGVLLRDGIRRDYRFRLTVRDTLSIGHELVGTRQVGFVKTTSQVIDAGIDGAAGVVLRVFNQAIALTRGGFIAMAVVKTIMRVAGLYPGLRAPQGEDYLNLAIKLGFVSGDAFAGVGAVAASLVPRQQLIARPARGPGQPVPPKGSEPVGKKLVFDLADVDVSATALVVKGLVRVVEREPRLSVLGNDFVFHSDDRTSRGPVHLTTFDVPLPLARADWTATGGTATPASGIKTTVSAEVQANFMPVTAKVHIVDQEGRSMDGSGSFIATSTVGPPPPLPPDKDITR